jgi:transposase
MPKRLVMNAENAPHEELLLAMRLSPTKEGYIVFQGIDFLYQGKSIKETSNLLRVSERTVRNWVNKYNESGVSGLAYRGKSGRPRKISIAKFQAEYVPLALEPKQIGVDNFTAIKFHKYLTEGCKEKLCYQTLLNYFHENDLSLVVPRPQVIDKQDKDERDEFVARISELANAKEEIWFCDEVGFEGDPRPRARWVKKGSKPVNGRASEHLRFSAIGAINPLSGESFSLVVPQVDTSVFQVYLDELNVAINNRSIILVLDNASWHKTTALNWHNIKPLYLPPYSPDLNPIENLWRFLKINHFSNWYAKNIEELIEKICSTFNSLTKEQIIQTTNPKYLFQ